MGMIERRASGLGFRTGTSLMCARLPIRQNTGVLSRVLCRRRITLIGEWSWRRKSAKVSTKGVPLSWFTLGRRSCPHSSSEQIIPGLVAGLVDALAEIVPEAWLPKKISRLIFCCVLTFFAWKTAIGALSTLINGALFCGLTYGAIKIGSSRGDTELRRLDERMDQFLEQSFPAAWQAPPVVVESLKDRRKGLKRFPH